MPEKLCFAGRSNVFAIVSVSETEVIAPEHAILELMSEEDVRNYLGKRQGSTVGGIEAAIEAAKKGINVSVFSV